MSEARYAHAPTVFWRRASGVVLLLDRAPDAEIVELTGSGILLWELLSSPVTAAEAAGELAELYGADAGEVLADIEPVLEHLVARGYATRVEAS